MRRFTFLVPLALAGALAACDSDVDSPESVRLSLLLTDDPGDFSAAVVTISSIYLQGGNNNDGDGDGRVVLLDEPVTTNLITLVDDYETLVDGAIIPAGVYGQLRFVIDGAYIVVETANGEAVYATPGYAEAPEDVDGVLQCPSCGQSGIKVNFVGGLTLGEEDEVVLVDFDVSETFGHQAGNSGMWVMNPSLKAAPFDEAASLEVSLGLDAGVTLPVIGAAAPTLADFRAELRGAAADPSAPGEEVAFTDSDGNGVFEASFGNVVPGDYLLVIEAPAGLTIGTSPAFPLPITVEAGGTATASFMITSAAAAT